MSYSSSTTRIFRLVVVQNVRAIHLAVGVHRVVRLVRRRQHNDTLVCPIIQIVGGIQPHTPMPDLPFGNALFLVFAVPIILTVGDEHIAHGRQVAAPTKCEGEIYIVKQQVLYAESSNEL